MCDVVDQAMRAGALGLSSSLQYVPDMYNSTEELIAMAKVAAKYGGAYFTHQRSESGRMDQSMDEVFRIAKEGGLRAQVWHFKTAYAPNFGKMPAMLGKIEDALRARYRRRGQPVSVEPRLERPRRVPAALGPGGGARSPVEAPGRPGDARARQDGHGEGRDRLGEPVARRGRRGGRHGGRGPLREVEALRGQDDRRDRRRGEEGPARRRHRHRRGRPGQRLLHHLDHGREGRPRRARPPARLLRHGLPGQGDRRAFRQRNLAPAGMGLRIAHPRLLRARREGAAPRGSGPQDDLVLGGGGGHPRSRARQGRILGGCCRAAHRCSFFRRAR